LDELIEGKVVEFETKSFALTPKGVALLDEILLALSQAPEVRILIAGHTDSRGSDAENLQLSVDRANAVLDYLVAAGESKDRFDVIGYGEDLPTESNDTSAGRSRNRRIEFIALEGTS
jgi:OOP family OmpA-OmpF porin